MSGVAVSILFVPVLVLRARKQSMFRSVEEARPIRRLVIPCFDESFGWTGTKTDPLRNALGFLTGNAEQDPAQRLAKSRHKINGESVLLPLRCCELACAK